MKGPCYSAVVVLGAVVGVVGDSAWVDGVTMAVAFASIGVGLGRARPLAVPACLLGVALALGASARDRALNSPLNAWFASQSGGAESSRGVVWIEGVIARDAAPAADGVRLPIDVTRLRETADGDWREVRGRLRAFVAGAPEGGAIETWTRGRVIRAPMVLRRPAVLRNFGLPGERWQTLQRDFDLAATIKSGALIDVTPAAPWHEAGAAIRRHVRLDINRSVGASDPIAAAVLLAILIGDRAGLGDDLERRLQMAGTYHVIAISGGNVALVAGACLLMVRRLVRGHRAAPLLTASLVLTYGWIVGGDPSVTRACTAACAYLVASAAGIRPRGVHLIAAIAAAFAIIDPIMTIDVGAWLSFGATFGIVTMVPRLMRRVPVASAVVRWPMALLLGLLAATVAAELMVMPIAASVFGRVTLAGLVLNFIAVPAMALAQIAGAAVLAFSVCPSLAGLAAATAASAARAVIDSASLVDAAPWSTWRVPPSPLVIVVVYYLALGTTLLAAAVPWLQRFKRFTYVAAAACFTIIALGLEWPRTPSTLRLVMVDVGQGEALLVRLPNGRAFAVDAGGAVGTFDIGSRIVTPALWAHGVRRLDWLAVTHPDQDHIGGALSVAGDLAPREVWEGIAVDAHAPLEALRDSVHTRGVTWRAVRAGETLTSGGVRIDVLHPPRPDWDRVRVRNDDSIVLRLSYGRVEFLLTGDAGSEFESSFAPRPSDGTRIRVLKAGHHGSRTSSSSRFVRAYRPDIVVISAGRGNVFGHPARDVLARFTEVGAQIFRTDADGAVIVETDGDQVVVVSHGGRTWRTGVLPLS